MHEAFHTKFGFCPWDIAALIVLVALIAVLAVHIVKQSRREKKLEDELNEKLEAEANSEENAVL